MATRDAAPPEPPEASGDLRRQAARARRLARELSRREEARLLYDLAAVLDARAIAAERLEAEDG
jgi:hypothetical protein